MSEANTVPVDPRLLESEMRYRAVIENASDMIQSIRLDGTFEFVNPAWLRTLGYTADEVEHLIIWDIVHPDAMSHCQQLFMRVMQGERIDNVETTFITKDGRPVPVEGSATVRMVDGQVIATHSFFRDISERLRAAELEARNAQLEREQFARYLEKMAALGKLSAGLAHELNNPAAAAQRASAQLLDSLVELNTAVRQLTISHLTGDQAHPLDALLARKQNQTSAPLTLSPLEISEREEAIEEWLADHQIEEAWNLSPTLVNAGITVAMLEQLATEVPSTALATIVHCIGETLVARDLADVIARSTSRISDLVAAVKAYSYMDRMPEQVVDVHDGIENTLIILSHRLKSVTIIRDYERQLPPVSTVGSGLNQVWTNILDNAIDATGGTGTISIRTRQVNDQAVVEIADDGRGIPEEIITRIFEPFFTTKPQGEGTGLGLDTVWRIVTEQLNGTIEVESRPGETLFRVALPLESGDSS